MRHLNRVSTALVSDATSKRDALRWAGVFDLCFRELQHVQPSSPPRRDLLTVSIWTKYEGEKPVSPTALVPPSRGTRGTLVNRTVSLDISAFPHYPRGWYCAPVFDSREWAPLVSTSYPHAYSANEVHGTLSHRTNRTVLSLLNVAVFSLQELTMM